MRKKYNYNDICNTQSFLEVVQLRFANQTGVFLTSSQLFVLLKIIFFSIFELTANKSVALKYMGTFQRFKSTWKHPKTGSECKTTIKFQLAPSAREILNCSHNKKDTFFPNEKLYPLEYFLEKKKIEREKKVVANRLNRFKEDSKSIKQALIKKSKELDEALYNGAIAFSKKTAKNNNLKNDSDFEDLSNI